MTSASQWNCRRCCEKASTGFSQDVSVGDLRKAAERLSGRYRGEVRDGRFHLSDSLATSAYLATRLPATYAAIRASLSAVADIRPEWEPQTLLDIGSGPGSVLWAACDQWPSIEHATMIEGCDPIRRVGEKLAQRAESRRTAWIAADIQRGLPALESADLVTLSYVLGELAPAAIARLTERLWELSRDVLLVVEPGTPAGWQRILLVRDRLIALGAHIVAPCTHAERCPLAAPDWCHFSRRVARSRRTGSPRRPMFRGRTRSSSISLYRACRMRSGRPRARAPARRLRHRPAQAVQQHRAAGRTSGDEATGRRFQGGAPRGLGRSALASCRAD